MTQGSSKDQESRVERNGSEGPDETANRRKMLRRSAVMLPTIVTLYSGSVAARSSNLLRLVESATPDANGDYRCIDLSSGSLEGNALDVGTGGEPIFTPIPEGEWVDSDGAEVSVETMCRDGGTYTTKDGTATVTLEGGGAFASMAAWGSFTTRIRGEI